MKLKEETSNMYCSYNNNIILTSTLVNLQQVLKVTENISHLLYSHLFDGLRPDRVPVSDDHISHALRSGKSTV